MRHPYRLIPFLALMATTAFAVPPSNDLCTGAMPLSDNVPFTMNTAAASDDTGLCISRPQRGVWFSFTPGVTGWLNVETVTPGWSPNIEVFSGSCGALREEACQIGFDFISNRCTAGTTYLVCFSGNGSTPSGDMQIRLHAALPPPTNDTCDGAASLPDGAYLSQSTGAAYDDAGGAGGPIGRGIWFVYTAPVSGIATLDTCPSDFNTKVEVFNGPCDTLNPLASNDGSPACGDRATLSFPCAAGCSYWICAGGSGNASGTLQIYCRAAPPGGNDTCATALPLLDDVVYTEGTTNLSDDATSCAGTISRGAWFTYVAPVTGTALVESCGSDFDTRIAVFATDCAGPSLGCNDDSTVCGTRAALSFAVTQGRTYLLCAGGSAGAAGTLRIHAHARGRSIPLDFDGDSASDLCSYDYLTGIWSVDLSNGGRWAPANAREFNFGFAGTVPLPADYDGDGKEDLAVFHPPSATWYIARSSAGFQTLQYGFLGAVPVTGDYDGDGRADVGCYEPARGRWFVQLSGGGQTNVQWGFPGTSPMPADYDGDGKTDFACYFPGDGQWYVRKSSGGAWNTQLGGDAGHTTMDVRGTIPFTGDFDGDGRADLAASTDTFLDGNNSITRLACAMSSSGGLSRTVWYWYYPTLTRLVGPYLTTGDYDRDGRIEFHWLGLGVFNVESNLTNGAPHITRYPSLRGCGSALDQTYGWPVENTGLADLSPTRRYTGRLASGRTIRITVPMQASTLTTHYNIGTFSDASGASATAYLGDIYPGGYDYLSSSGTPSTGPVTVMVRLAGWNAVPLGFKFGGVLPMYFVSHTLEGTYIDAQGSQPLTLTYKCVAVLIYGP